MWNNLISLVRGVKCLALFPLHSDEITQQKIPPPIRFSPKLDLCFIYLFSSFARNVLLSFALFWHPHSPLLFVLVSVFTCCKIRWQFIHRLSMKKNSRIFRFINCPLQAFFLIVNVYLDKVCAYKNTDLTIEAVETSASVAVFYFWS